MDTNIFLFKLLILCKVIPEIASVTCGTVTCMINPYGCKQDQHGRDVCDCFRGYLGDACEKDQDECTYFGDHTPCGHRGNCVNTVGSYTCDCLYGWAALNCRTRTSTPNFNCFAGWTGHICDDDIDECIVNASPCPRPHEHCVNTKGSYNCTCNVGWQGSDCMEDVDECVNNPCGDRQMCQNTIGSFVCPCVFGWYGLNCDQNINECVTEPCGSSGTCIDTEGSFVCECSSGFTGNTCETELPDTIDTGISIPLNFVVVGSAAGVSLLALLCALTAICCMKKKIRSIRDKHESVLKAKGRRRNTATIQPISQRNDKREHRGANPHQEYATDQSNNQVYPREMAQRNNPWMDQLGTKDHIDKSHYADDTQTKREMAPRNNPWMDQLGTNNNIDKRHYADDMQTKREMAPRNNPWLDQLGTKNIDKSHYADDMQTKREMAPRNNPWMDQFGTKDNIDKSHYADDMQPKREMAPRNNPWMDQFGTKDHTDKSHHADDMQTRRPFMRGARICMED